jgi:glyoxylase-like metal-dependent hydrolase (beta-lactamase superfamily II)
VIVERSMDPGWLSNAYLIGDEPGGTAVFVDSGAPLEPLFEAVERHGLSVSHLLTTHADADHIAGDDEIRARYGCPVVKGDLETGGLSVRALETPGHKDDHLAFVVKALGSRAGSAGADVSSELCCSGDVLFKDAVGGGDFEQIRRSVMDVLMKLAPETRVLPGHTDETTIGREWEHNLFVRVWRAAEPEGTERVRVGGEQATLIVWSPDYDGKGKAWVRFADGRDAIVGGSRVERG